MYALYFIAHEPASKIEIVNGGIKEQHGVALLEIERRREFLIASDGFENDGLTNFATLDAAHGVGVCRVVTAHVAHLQANTGFAHGVERAIGIGKLCGK